MPRKTKPQPAQAPDPAAETPRITIDASESPRRQLEAAQLALEAALTIGNHAPTAERGLLTSTKQLVDESLALWTRLEKHFVFGYKLSVKFEDDTDGKMSSYWKALSK